MSAQGAVALHSQIPAPRQERVSGKIKIAIDAMVLEALPRCDAAKKAGISEHGLYKAMRKVPVMAYMRDMMGVLRTSAAARTVAKAEQLMDKAESEHVQADMTKWLAGLEGISPTQHIENTHIHRNAQPGLTVNFMLPAMPEDMARVIDGQVCQAESSPVINGLPTPVPHPSMRNARMVANPPDDVESPVRPTGGVK